MRRITITATALAVGSAAVALALPSASSSSHREAPGITEMPKVDGTDFYMFRSYETGREGFVTLVANYLPLQDPYGGPNYFVMDPAALYEIHIDNDGDAEEDITFQFRFEHIIDPIALMVGTPGQEVEVAVPLVNIGDATMPANVQSRETFGVNVVFGDRRTGNVAA